MPYIVPVNLGREIKTLFVWFVLGVFGFGFTAEAFGERNWRWFAGFLVFTVVMFLLAVGQAIFIHKVAKLR
jgi:hypothetical protein